MGHDEVWGRLLGTHVYESNDEHGTAGLHHPAWRNEKMSSEKSKSRLRLTKPRSKKGYARPRIEKALAEGDIDEVIDRLNVRQRRFCEEYLIDYNATQALIRAGYVCKYPTRQSYQMLRNPAIRACIDKLTLERASTSVLKPEYVTNKIVKTIEKAETDNNHAAVLRGCELLARHLGMFIERQEISGPNGSAIELKQVKDAADAFTSAIAGLVERGGEGRLSLVPNTGSKG